MEKLMIARYILHSITNNHMIDTRKINSKIVVGNFTRKKHVSLSEKNELWKLFDSDNVVETKILSLPLNNNLAIHHNCNHCDSLLTIMEDGFPTCTKS